ncbi:hypothetical protein ILUMI_01040 [Ignelater luminosus]|uniref:Family 31 glucosidase KIAA1161 n=1 Tax=Ignelater luminosus TaxID=2038154 RepID=A0A8K0DKG2_IGNLU|nr:hypothetical protein ILUMI_01040 [Ignelater luminosus]
MKLLAIFLLFCVAILECCSQSITVQNNGLSLSITPGPTNLNLSLQQGNSKKLSGVIGRNLQNSSNYQPCQDVPNCLEFENGTIRLHVMTDIDHGFTIYWITEDVSKVLEDCFELSDLNWYGGPERFEQAWPLQKLNLTNFANVLQEDQWGAIVEPYWLNSAGAYIFVNEKVPLFVNQNSLSSTRNKVCFSANVADPYPPRNKVVLHYTVASQPDARKAHLHAVKHFLGKPTGHPNYKILERPIWSTWARYKRDVNDSAVLAFAKDIVDNGYPDGQFEIDDHWEECYGALTFNLSRFGDINNTVAKIKSMNFRVTLWTHPFVNTDCVKYREIGRRYGYFAKNSEGNDLTKWWNSKGNDAHYLDFSKAEVRLWFTERLRSIQEKHGIDSFKFDAGETSWAPQVPVLNGDVDGLPNTLGADYARTCAAFGDLVEVRTGWRTQDLPVFVRMIDKDSTWGLLNGLYTLITTLLQMNLNGYTLVLPNMVGGNGYYGTPSAELFVRWLQANTFMPSIQFSYVPWDYDNEKLNFDVKAISKKFVNLHQKIAPYIEKTMRDSVEKGHPVNSPIWWVSPNDIQAQGEDTEFLLGEDILVAPVVQEGATNRTVYLPKGRWVDGNSGVIHNGPRSLVNYSAPIEVLPYFIREGSEALRLLQRPL